MERCPTEPDEIPSEVIDAGAKAIAAIFDEVVAPGSFACRVAAEQAYLAMRAVEKTLSKT